MKNKNVIIGLILLLIVGVVAYFLLSGKKEETPATVTTTETTGLGNILSKVDTGSILKSILAA